jgi:hypothetical protein
LKVFRIFSSAYGRKWDSVVDTAEKLEDATGIWNTSIQDIPDHFLRRGLQDCVVKFDWPPSIKEFRDLCLSYHSKYLDAKKIVAPRVDLTPEQEREKAIMRKEHMEKIWGILGMPRKICET